jgi:uncharacterized tellurite resistance protein B-like protein
MDHLPVDFAARLARVVEPGQESAVAEVIEAATRLDDEGLRMFLEKFAARIRASADPVRREELVQFLQASKQGGSATAS